MKKELYTVLFALFTILGCLSSIGAAQSISRPDRGVGAAVPYGSSGIENINMQNGNVNLSIPLASLPPIAGGKLSFTLRAEYNSKLWDTHLEERFIPAPPAEEGQPTFYAVSIPQLSNTGGWRIGGGYGIDVQYARDDYILNDKNYSLDAQVLRSGNYSRTFFVTPDGSQHEIRPLGYPAYDGNYEMFFGYFKDNPNSTGVPMRYYSVDGTYISLTLYPSSYPLAWEAILPDGTKIQETGDNRTQRIIDSNGNKIKIFNDIDGTHYQDEQTGREIKTKYNNETGKVEVWYQTVGGSWQKVEITFGTTTVSGKFYTVERPEAPYFPSCTFQEGPISEQLSVIREIVFPQTEPGQDPPKYTFSYNSDQTDPNSVYYTPGCNTYPPTATYANPSIGLGEVSQISTPAGAIYQYSYSMDHDSVVGGLVNPDIGSSTITQKKIIHDGVTKDWTYNITPYGASVNNPDGSTGQTQSYGGHYPSVPSTNGGAGGLDGLVYRETKSNRIRTERHWGKLVFYGGNTLSPGGYSGLVFNPVVTDEYTSLLDDSGNPIKMSAKTFQYDYNGNLLLTREYDWFDPNSVSRDSFGIPVGVPASATLLREVTNSFHHSPTASTSQDVYAKTPNSILNALKETTVGPGITRYSYDNQAYGMPPTNGNVTTVSAWDNTSTQFINSQLGYDSYGNAISKTDPKGNVTQIAYADATHAMPTSTTVDPQNGTGPQTASTTYDYYTGLPLTSTDINGNVSSVDYTNNLLGTVDPFGRPGTAFEPYVNVDGVSKRQTVKTYYEDGARRTRVESDLFNEGDALLKARASRDQLGRPILSEKNENGSSTYTIFSQTVYDTQNRVVMTSNPMRSTTAAADGWTRSTSDILGRNIETATFSGASQPPITGTNASWTGSVTATYTENATTVTDQAGKQRRSITNVLGQLTRVDEPNDAGALGAIDAPNQPTYYTYDLLNNLTTVQQAGVNAQQCGGAPNCSQTRTFTYNSLSRLLSATNPESGTINYGYDPNGNLTSKTDARNITTNYYYDALNRVTSRTYSDNTTPNVTYTYDNLPNAKGKLTKVTTGAGATPLSVTEYQAFDIAGRVTQSQQWVDGTAYGDPMTYTYNLSGALIEEKYPSGRVAKNTLDGNGDLSQVQSRKNVNYGFSTYANSFTYNAAGAVTSMQLGNGHWESTQFNSRLQPTEIALGTSQNAMNLLKLDYTYNTPNTTDNNGNILSQTITVPTVGANQGFTAVQNYTYDSLNRLKQATEAVGGNQSWQQAFSYDRYGNRNFDEANTTTLPKNCGTAPNNVVCTADRPVVNPSVNPSNNRFAAGQNYGYDPSGNTTTDATGRTFVYDAENKQTSVSDQNGTIGQYFYDGDGKRIKKIVPSTGETTIFVYSTSGQLVAEYSTQISQTPQVSYLTNDHLGSPRINTDQNGNVTARHDYMPFGEEIFTYGGRVAGLGYDSDNVRKKYRLRTR